ncbi:MAG: GerMN domain-containing protein [Spirochaetales bacterium]|nr:GerMN domain-containing protein [Spirochaetales bacterium]
MAGKKVSIGCLFWIVLILLVIVIVLANLKTANDIIKKTGFEEMVKNMFSGDKKEKKPDLPVIRTKDNVEDEIKVKRSDDSIPENDPVDTVIDKKDEELPRNDDASGDNGNELPDPTPLTVKRNMRRALIYFARVNDDGTIALKGFKKSVYYDDSPLKETILTLLGGPGSQEINANYYSLIPEHTTLNNIYVKGSIAYLDFNEYFRFNTLGKEGLKTQLKQIVYTATEFANVTGVQILIEGEKVNYLGPEGIFIGEPLSRDSFIASN